MLTFFSARIAEPNHQISFFLELFSVTSSTVDVCELANSTTFCLYLMTFSEALVVCKELFREFLGVFVRSKDAYSPIFYTISFSHFSTKK